MKKICFVILFILGFANIFAQTSNYDANTQYRRIGYTTNYSNGVYNSTVYKDFNTSTKYYGYRNYTNSSYGSGTTTRGGHPGNVRRSAQRPFSGNFLEDLADWWRMATDSNWPGYVDDDYWEEFLSLYPEYEDEARAWFEEQGRHFPGDPYDPFGDPIGDFPILLLFMLVFAYIYYKKTMIKK